MVRWAAAGLALMAASATAQTGGAAADRVLRAFDACRQIVPAEERAACFDQSAAALARAVAAREVRIVDRREVDKARRSLFGFTLPNLNIFGGGGDRDAAPFVEINSTVQSARAAENGRAQIVLADEGNAVWLTTDPLSFPPRPGARIRIRKGTLGNYFLNVDGRTYRATRVH